MRRVAIHSVPRSGSTWLGQILNSSPVVAYRYQPLFSYAFKDRLNESSTQQDIQRFFEDIANSDDAFLNQVAAIERGIIPLFDKQETLTTCVYKEVRYHHIVENLLRKDPEVRVIGLIRNPLAVLASWRSAPKEFDPKWNFAVEWQDAPSKNQGRSEEYYGYQKWKEVARLFDRLEREASDRFLKVCYDDLLSHTERAVESIFAFCRLAVTNQTTRFLRASSQSNHSDPYSVYKSRSTDRQWIGNLPSDIVAAVQTDLQGTSLEAYLGSIDRECS